MLSEYASVDMEDPGSIAIGVGILTVYVPQPAISVLPVCSGLHVVSGNDDG